MKTNLHFRGLTIGISLKVLSKLSEPKSNLTIFNAKKHSIVKYMGEERDVKWCLRIYAVDCCTELFEGLT